MARARQDDPVFRSSGGVLQFTNDLAIPAQWRSILPPLTFFEAMAVDTSLAGGFSFDFESLDELGKRIQAQTGSGKTSDDVIRDMIQNNTSGVMEHLKEVAALDVVRALRGIIGQVAVTVGYTQQTLDGPVRDVYKDPLATAAMWLDYANKVFTNKYFRQALDGIAWIPIVGWIIKIVVEVLNIIAKIADYVRTKHLDKMSAGMAQRFHLPIIGDNADLANKYNEEMVRMIMRWTQGFQLWRTFQPPFIPPGGSGKWIETIAARDPERGDDYAIKGKGYKLTDLWYMRGVEGLPGGAGFMPGGVDILRMLEFRPTYGGAAPTNTGDYMVTARQMGAYLWATVLSRGPALFTVNARQTRDHWDAYVHALLEYGDRCLSKGFTVSESALQTIQEWDNCSDQEWCGPWNQRDPDCKKKDFGKVVHFPGGKVSHLGELLMWTAEQFWGRGPDKRSFPFDIRDISRDWDPDHYYYDNTTYAHALKDLGSRQDLIARGYEALGVFPGTTFETDDGTKVEKDDGIFPAFGTPGNWNSDLIDTWMDTLKMIIEDEAAWKTVPYQEIPQYRWKGQSPREIVKAKQQETLGYLVARNGPRPILPGSPDMFPPGEPPDLSGTGKEGIILNPEEVDPPPERPTPVKLPTASRVMLASGSAMAAVGLGAVLTKRAVKFFT